MEIISRLLTPYLMGEFSVIQGSDRSIVIYKICKIIITQFVIIGNGTLSVYCVLQNIYDRRGNPYLPIYFLLRILPNSLSSVS